MEKKMYRVTLEAKEIGVGERLFIGGVATHPSGRKVYITGGRYMGDHGYSNFWFWKELKEDGTLGEQESGYGWQ